MVVSRERQRYLDRVEEDSSFGCYYRVEKDLEIHRATVRYWYLKKKREREDPVHEGARCGGYRFSTVKIWERASVRQYIIEFLTAFPYSTLENLAKELTFCLDRNVTRKVRLRILIIKTLICR